MPLSILSRVTVDRIQQEIDAGYIREEWHESGKLRILNYTQRTQFEWHWNDETLVCRGLIVDLQNHVVARPFEKFFSYEQLSGNVPSEPFEVFEKLDGSLEILYQLEQSPAIATRGSFVSDQARRATEILEEKYAHVPFDENLTYLFEIILPNNRIVVDYGDVEDLFLLAIVETSTGKELPLTDIGIPLVKRYDGLTDLAQLLENDETNREGFVVRFSSGMRVKIKFEEYKRIHRLITFTNTKHIWEALKSGDDFAELVEQVPDEFFDWLNSTVNELKSKYSEVEEIARQEFQACGGFSSRKEAAEHFGGCSYPSIMFAMYDEKDYSEQIWRAIRPESEMPPMREL